MILRQADGRQGLAAEGPFGPNRRVGRLWRASAGIWLTSCRPGGIAVTVIGPAEGEQALVKLSKIGSRFDREEIAKVRLQPLPRDWRRQFDAGSSIWRRFAAIRAASLTEQ